MIIVPGPLPVVAAQRCPRLCRIERSETLTREAVLGVSCTVNTIAVKALLALVRLPLAQLGSRKALNIGEAFVALP